MNGEVLREEGAIADLALYLTRSHNQKYSSNLTLQTKIEKASFNKVKPMAVRQRRYSKEELAQRGQELYESGIRQQVEAGNEGKIVAIDIETGTFEVDENLVPATNRLFDRYPDAQPWVIRIGHRAVDHFGARSLKTNS
jgi:hypothetical protein